MERSKKFQDFINRLPETGTPLIEWHKWLIRNHFKPSNFMDYSYVENYIDHTYIYTEKRYKGYQVRLLIENNTSSIYYLRNKLIDYLKYEKKHETAPIVFQEYDKTIEEKNINYFQVRIYNIYNKDEDITVY